MHLRCSYKELNYNVPILEGMIQLFSLMTGIYIKWHFGSMTSLV